MTHLVVIFMSKLSQTYVIYRRVSFYTTLLLLLFCLCKIPFNLGKNVWLELHFLSTYLLIWILVLVQIKFILSKSVCMPFVFTVGLWYFTISFTCRLSHSLISSRCALVYVSWRPRIVTFLPWLCSYSADKYEITLLFCYLWCYKYADFSSSSIWTYSS